jgi:hypothetical protein
MPRRFLKRSKAEIKELVSNEYAISKWTQWEVRQVKRQPQRLVVRRKMRTSINAIISISRYKTYGRKSSLAWNFQNHGNFTNVWEILQQTHHEILGWIVRTNQGAIYTTNIFAWYNTPHSWNGCNRNKL